MTLQWLYAIEFTLLERLKLLTRMMNIAQATVLDNFLDFTGIGATSSPVVPDAFVQPLLLNDALDLVRNLWNVELLIHVSSG